MAIDGAAPGVVEAGERDHLVQQLQVVEAENQARHQMTVRTEFEIVEKRVRGTCEKARER